MTAPTEQDAVPLSASIARVAALGVAGVALGIGAVLTVQVAVAWGGYQDALATRLNEVVKLEASRSVLDSAIADATARVELADAALAAAPVGYVSAESATALQQSSEALATSIQDTRTIGADPQDAPPPAFTAAGLWSARAAALAQATAAVEDSQQQVEAIESLTEVELTISDAGVGLITSAKALAATVLPANPSVANRPHVAFLQLLDRLAAEDQLDAAAVELLTEYVVQAQAVSASHAAEEAEKAGPLYGVRAEIEAYARSISGGVLLDFNWQPIVIGYGDGGTMAGTATVEPGDILVSTITLTNTIAEFWGGGVTPISLVTHEVGHAITSKCLDMFEANFGGDYEQFATAWAMSWGMPAGPSGGNEYGVPSADLVAIAGTCR